ncbi:hypothetical protein [Candidatus Methylocalor cossyra]|uniref:DUF4412 domain-containing protein n=1 Tax=Candidatus Methylocalor cossyra TaxID=3108543 RepID=A0ABM9NLF8_9GAMM
MSHRFNRLRALSAALLCFAAAAAADSTLDFQVQKGERASSQPVLIQPGTVLIRSAGGQDQLDILYERNPERLVLIDHSKQRYTPITDQEVDRLARQAEELKPLLRGLGEQLRKLPPKQREKWQGLLGGLPLDEFDAAKHTLEATSLHKTGVGKSLAGIACQQLRVVKGGTPAAELCLANPSTLPLPADDSATLLALLEFTQRLARKAQALTLQFGIDLPAGSVAELSGIPLELRELEGKQPLSLALRQISGGALGGSPLRVPEGYRARDLVALWH